MYLKHMIQFLIYFLIPGILFICFPLSINVSYTQNSSEEIVFVGKAILLKKDYTPIYINISTDICPGRITLEFDNGTYSYGYKCIQSLNKPFIDIKHLMYHYLNITVYTPSYIGVIIEIPVKVAVKIINKTNHYMWVKLSIYFTHTRYIDIIPEEIKIFNPKYVLLNNRKLSINESARWIHNITYTIKLLTKNNNAFINNTLIGFFPFYINTPINAREIEKLVDKGFIKFTEDGFNGEMLKYMNKSLYLSYIDPYSPLIIRSNQFLRFNPFTNNYYIYDPDPLYYTSYNGISIPVPGIREAYMYPFRYNASQIMSHIRGFKLVKCDFFSSINQEINVPIVEIHYLYKYPISLNVVFPIYFHKLFNTKYVLFYELKLTSENMTKIHGYSVGSLNSKYLRVYSEKDFRIFVTIIITLFILSLVHVGYKKYLKNH